MSGRTLEQSGKNLGLVVDTLSRMWLDNDMNRNSNHTITVTLTNGTERTITHRNTLNGWVNALKRAGIDPNEVVSQVDGLPESARVA